MQEGEEIVVCYHVIQGCAFYRAKEPIKNQTYSHSSENGG